MFVNKKKASHAAAGESGFWAGTPPEQLAPRKSCQFYTTYAVVDSGGNVASGRAEEPILFSQKICTVCKFFVKKVQNVPCCRRRIGLLGWHAAGTVGTA